MNRIFTTGEMIDKLKFGEVAVCENGNKVTKTCSGSIIYADSLRVIKLNDRNIEAGWRIMKFISFNEAMKVLQNEGVVTFHGSKGESTLGACYTTLDEPIRELLLSKHSFNELFERKWTIEVVGHEA